MSALAEVLTAVALMLGALPLAGPVTNHTAEVTSALAGDYLLGVPGYVPRSLSESSCCLGQFQYLQQDGQLWPLRKGKVQTQLDSQWLLASLAN